MRRKDRLVGSIDDTPGPARDGRMRGQIRVEHDRAVERAERGVIVAGKERERQAGKIQHPGIIAGGGDRLPRHADPFLDFRARGGIQCRWCCMAAAQGDPRHGRSVGGIEFERLMRQPNRLRPSFPSSFCTPAPARADRDRRHRGSRSVCGWRARFRQAAAAARWRRRRRSPPGPAIRKCRRACRRSDQPRYVRRLSSRSVGR